MSLLYKAKAFLKADRLESRKEKVDQNFNLRNFLKVKLPKEKTLYIEVGETIYKAPLISEAELRT